MGTKSNEGDDSGESDQLCPRQLGQHQQNRKGFLAEDDIIVMTAQMCRMISMVQLHF